MSSSTSQRFAVDTVENAAATPDTEQPFTALGLPVPPGFTITTEACSYFYANERRYPESLKGEVAEALSRVESLAGKRFGDAANPRERRVLLDESLEVLQRLLTGEIIWAPAISGAVVLTTRGGDFSLHLGQDLSIGYLSHTDAEVSLYLQESLTFLMLTSEAAVGCTPAG